MANRISELEARLRQWESGKQKRTAAFTLVPIAAALGVGWYAQDRVGSLERGLDDTLASLEVPMVEEDGGRARLARLDGLRDEVVELRAMPDALNEANAERDALTAELAGMSSEVERLQSEIQSVSSEREALASQLASQEAALAETAAALRSAEERLTGLETTKAVLAEAKTALAEAETDRAALAAEADELRGAREGLERESSRADRELEAYRAVVAEQEAALAETTDALIAAERQLSALGDAEAERGELGAASDALFRDAAMAERELMSYRTLVARQEAALAEMTDSAMAAEGRVAQLEADRAALKDALAEAEQPRSGELERQLELATSTVTALQTVRDGLEDRLAVAQDAVIESEAAAVERSAAMMALTADRDTAMARQASLEARLVELEARLAVREATTVDAEAERQAALASVASLEGDLKAMQAEVADREAALDEATAERGMMRADLMALEERLEEARAAADAAMTATTAAERLATSEAEQRHAAEARVAELEAEAIAGAATQPLAAGDRAQPIDALLDVDAATRERLTALTAELAELRTVTETQRAALADQQAAAASHVDAISAQLSSSLLQQPSAEVAGVAAATVARESSLTSELVARIAGADDVSLVNGRDVAYTAGLIFNSGEAELSPGGQAELNQIALQLRTLVDVLPDDLPWMLRVDGHTDDLPVRSGRFRSNWELSAARASTVAVYLTEWGIPADRLIAAGFADTQPVATGADEAARQQNRRIELRLTVR